MRRLFFSILLVFPAFSDGQVRIKEIKEVNPQHKDQQYMFPLIVISNNKAVAHKINDFLLADFLDADRRKVNKSIFENVWSTADNPSARLSDIEYKVIENNKKLLSISISAEGCGAYCESFIKYYSFDLKTGNRIELNNLLNKTGVLLLLDSINVKKRRMLTSKIKEIQDTVIKTGRVTKDEKEYYDETLSLYQECFERNDETVEYLRFYITRDELFVSLDRCSAHVNRALDEIGDFKFVFKLKNWNKYLTSFAKNLIRP